MEGLDNLVEDWLGQVEQMADLSLAEKEEITGAGAKVFADELEKATKSKHTGQGAIGGKHLYEAIGIEKTGKGLGTQTVGFDNDHAYIARFLNDGTKKMRGDNFVHEVQESKEVQEKVFEAEMEAYGKIIEGRG